MKNTIVFLYAAMAFLAISFGPVPFASAAIVSSTTHGAYFYSLDGQISNTDLIHGLIATELPGDNGWHPANPASGNSLHSDGLPAFTDGFGSLSSVTGLLNDFPGAGNPTKRIQYDLGGPKEIGSIQILSGNRGNDGRIFSTTVIHYSNDGGATFNMLGYFQSDPSGTINSGQWGSTLVEIYDDSSAILLAGVQSLQFEFYAVDNTGGQMRDPFDGVNPFTVSDDTLSAAFVAPAIYEIDVNQAVPIPSTLLLFGFGLAGVLGLKKKVKK